MFSLEAHMCAGIVVHHSPSHSFQGTVLISMCCKASRCPHRQHFLLLASPTTPLQSPLSSSKSAPCILLLCHKSAAWLGLLLLHPPAKDQQVTCPMATVGDHFPPLFSQGQGQQRPQGKKMGRQTHFIPPWKAGVIFWSPFSPSVQLEPQTHVSQPRHWDKSAWWGRRNIFDRGRMQPACRSRVWPSKVFQG